MTIRAIRFAVASVLAVLCIASASAQDRAQAPVSKGRVPVGIALTCPPCDDHNPCTADSCDGTTGTCRFDPLSCDDGNPCTTDLCQTIASNPGCAHVRVPDATPCDDGSSCTVEEACSAGICVPGRILDAHTPCDDGNSCTVSDACDPLHGCAGTPVVGGACDDHDACTRDDQCVAGPEGTALCEGTAQDCSDGNLCTQDRCDPATGICLHPPVDCADGNACTTDACDPATGLCRRDNVAGSCFDGLYCTTGETCVGGNCVGAQPIVCPQVQCGTNFCLEEDRVCLWRPSGGNSCPPAGQCTFYTCENGACRFNNASGQPCTLTGFCGLAQCVRGSCQPTVTFPCPDDGNPCTDEVCPQGSCTHPPKVDGTPCGDACATSTCQSGVCTVVTPTNCDDGDPCTVDSCDPAGGCRHAPKSCLDDNECTRDSCSAVSGECVHDPLSNVPCKGPGSDPCHAAYCQEGACTGLAPLSCDDGSVCTRDECDPARGCLHTVNCDDGNSCTADVCTTAGACQYVAYPAGFPCSDGNACTSHDLCTGPTGATVCVGTAASCDDGNACTADRCDAASGCVHDPVPPAKEVCNGKDDDCDGMVDEQETQALCTVLPYNVRDSMAMGSFFVSCRLTPACPGSVPPPVETIETVWLSAADLLFSMADDTELPDLADCQHVIVENPAKRMLGPNAVTFVFDATGNGVCGTSGGGRAGLIRELADVPDGKLARVCVKWRHPTAGDTQRCGYVLVKHDGSPEPHPLSPVDEEELPRVAH